MLSVVIALSPPFTGMGRERYVNGILFSGGGRGISVEG